MIIFNVLIIAWALHLLRPRTGSGNQIIDHEAMLRGPFLSNGDVGGVGCDVGVKTSSFSSMSSDDRLLMSNVCSRSGASCFLTMGIKPRSDSCFCIVCCFMDTDIDRNRHRIMADVVAKDPLIVRPLASLLQFTRQQAAENTSSLVGRNLRKPNLLHS